MTDPTAETGTDPDGPASETPHDPSGAWYRPKGLDEIRETYAEQADWMARMDWMNRLLTGRYRRRLFGRAEGRVLDVACGMGTNLRYLPDSAEYVGIDISPDMLAKAREACGGEPNVSFEEMDAQDVAFADDEFDTVISSLSTCTFPDPVVALEEMARVCAPEGRILLLEHGRSSVGAIARFQDWRADAHYEKHACRWNQEPLEVVSRAGIEVLEARTAALGIVTAIEARPA